MGHAGALVVAALLVGAFVYFREKSMAYEHEASCTYESYGTCTGAARDDEKEDDTDRCGDDFGDDCQATGFAASPPLHDDEEPLLRKRGNRAQDDSQGNNGTKAAEEGVGDDAKKLHDLFPAVDVTVCQFILEMCDGKLQPSIDYLVSEYSIGKVEPKLESGVAKAEIVRNLAVDEPAPLVVAPVADLDSVNDDQDVLRRRDDLLSELSYLSALEQEIERKRVSLTEQESALQALAGRVATMSTPSSSDIAPTDRTRAISDAPLSSPAMTAYPVLLPHKAPSTDDADSQLKSSSNAINGEVSFAHPINIGEKDAATVSYPILDVQTSDDEVKPVSPSASILVSAEAVSEFSDAADVGRFSESSWSDVGDENVEPTA